jgi:hypothetical protein
VNHDNDNAEKDETPTSDQASGVSSEQSELFDLPAFCPILPPHGSAAEQALNDLLTRDITQLDWLRSGNGWRLAAAVKELDYLGWCPISIRVKCVGWRRKIARYSLPAKAKQVAYAMREGMPWPGSSHE